MDYSTIVQYDSGMSTTRIDNCSRKLADDWFSVQQAADALKLTRGAVWGRIKAGKLHAEKVGALTLVRRAEVDQATQPKF